MNFSMFASVMVAAVLAGCGGGGGGAPTGSAPPSTNLTPEQAVATAKLSVLATVLFDAAAVEGAIIASSGFAGGSSAVGGSEPITTSTCTNGGTISAGITKAGVYAGYRPGDVVTLGFASCREGTTLLNGAMSITSNGTYANLSPTAFGGLAVTVRLTGFTGGTELTSSGTISIANMTVGNSGSSITVSYALPQTFTTGDPAVLTLSGNNLNQTTPSSFTIGQPKRLGLVGGVTVLSSSGNLGFVLTAVQPLVTTLPAVDSAPTAGVIRASAFVNIPAPAGASVQTSIAGAQATVAADTDGNGSLDYSVPIGSLSLLGL